MSQATLTINSRNYGAWSLRGWLLCRMAGLEFDEVVQPSDDPAARDELLLLSPSFLVPHLEHDGVSVWSTTAIGEYLHELLPEAPLLPEDPAARAHCRSIRGEIHAGFANLRSALPMNLKARHANFKVWAGARADIERITAIWGKCLDTYGGPFLFGERPTMADAMFAPVCSRFVTYAVPLDEVAQRYVDTIMALPDMVEWAAAAKAEPDAVDELDVEF
jgi:glutathione S-transferase